VVRTRFFSYGLSSFRNSAVGPYLSFEVKKPNFLGIALPNNRTVLKAPFVQSIYNGSDIPVIMPTPTNSYSFVSSYISVTKDTNNNNYVYFAGWNLDATSMNNSFVVVRGTLLLGNNNPEVLISWPVDVLPVSLGDPCFDQFGEASRPSLNTATNNDLILLVPGRCSVFARIKSTTGAPFSSSSVEILDPTKQVTSYVSSAVFDSAAQVIYFSIKTYQSSTTTLHAVDTSQTPMKEAPLALDLELLESETILVLGKEPPTTYLFVIASGSNRISRLLMNGLTYVSNTSAVIDSTINKISSALYYKPHLFFSTYEPDAKIVRITEENFCPQWCQDTGYCLLGACQCRPGFAKDPQHPTLGCRYVTLIDAEKSQVTNERASIALGVLFGITVVVAIVGWSCWWRAKSQKSQYASLVSGGGADRL